MKTHFRTAALFVLIGLSASAFVAPAGDVLLSLNGYKLTYPGSWNDALSNALYNNNYIRLKIRDVRTGNIYFRETFVDYNDGPVEHYYKSNNYAGPHYDNDVQNVGQTIKTIKDVHKFFDKD